MESKKQHTFVAIDISKKTLQVQVETPPQAFQIPYQADALQKLVECIGKLRNPWVVCEATGGYERQLLASLHQHDIAVSLLSPGRVRDFARSEGVKSKTDPIDTRMLLRFAKEKKLRRTVAPKPEREKLAAFADRREHLSEHLKREKTRLQNSPSSMHESIRRMIKALEEEIQLIENHIGEIIDQSSSLSRQFARMQTVKGVGPTTAWTLLAHLPEITSLKRNELVALVGVAPFNHDSGEKTGRRSIYGGRAKVRRCLYMAATSAAEHNPVIKPYTQRLIANGKSYKCAMVAAMRKILIHIHSLLKYQLNQPSPLA